MPRGIGLMRRDGNAGAGNGNAPAPSAPPSPMSQASEKSMREHFVPWSESRENRENREYQHYAPKKSPYDGPFKLELDCSSGKRLVFDEDPMKNARNAFAIADKFDKARDIIENGPFAFSENAKREVRTAVCTAQSDFHEYVEKISASIAKMKSECKCINCQVK